MRFLKNYLPWSNHNLFGLRLHLFTISIKALRTVLTLLSYNGLTHAYIVKTSMTHNKYLIFLFLEGNHPISVKSPAQILSLNLA